MPEYRDTHRGRHTICAGLCLHTPSIFIHQAPILSLKLHQGLHIKLPCGRLTSQLVPQSHKAFTSQKLGCMLPEDFIFSPLTPQQVSLNHRRLYLNAFSSATHSCGPENTQNYKYFIFGQHKLSGKGFFFSFVYYQLINNSVEKLHLSYLQNTIGRKRRVVFCGLFTNTRDQGECHSNQNNRKSLSAVRTGLEQGKFLSDPPTASFCMPSRASTYRALGTRANTYI